MTETIIKRSQVATFLNTGTTGTPIWSKIASGVTGGKIAYNPQTNETVYIDQDSGTTEVESYKPNMPVEAVAINGNPAFEFIDNLRKTRATGTAAHSEIVNVWLYETATAGAYPAEKQNVSIQVDDFGGDGGKSAMINYTINYLGDATQGSFNPTTSTFTAA